MTEWELRYVMSEHKISKKDLETILVCSARQVYRYLNGTAQLKGARLALLKRHLGAAYIDPNNQ